MDDDASNAVAVDSQAAEATGERRGRLPAYGIDVIAHRPIEQPNARDGSEGVRIDLIGVLPRHKGLRADEMSDRPRRDPERLVRAR